MAYRIYIYGKFATLNVLYFREDEMNLPAADHWVYVFDKFYPSAVPLNLNGTEN